MVVGCVVRPLGGSVMLWDCMGDVRERQASNRAESIEVLKKKWEDISTARSRKILSIRCHEDYGPVIYTTKYYE